MKAFGGKPFFFHCILRLDFLNVCNWTLFDITARCLLQPDLDRALSDCSDSSGKALSAHSDSPPAPFLSQLIVVVDFLCFHDDVLPSHLFSRLFSSPLPPSPVLWLHQSKQEAGGLGCDVVRVEVEESLTKEQLLETFITCGRDTHRCINAHTGREISQHIQVVFMFIFFLHSFRAEAFNRGID